jgi:hypothetical protein
VRYRLAVVAVVAAAMAFGVAVPVGAAPVMANTTQSFCGISWGSQLKSATGTTASPLTDVRGGRHACYDRLVLDFKGKSNYFHVEYVAKVPDDYTGLDLPERGSAQLRIASDNSGHYDDSTYHPANTRELVNVDGWQTFRQVVLMGGIDVLLGLRARLPFRVFYLDGPGAGSRLVIDVAHRW